MTLHRRVAVTGAGVVTPVGRGAGSVRGSIASGRRAGAPATLFDASRFASPLAAEVEAFDPRPSFRVPKALKLCDRRTRLAVAAAADAVEDARLSRTVPAEGIGVVIGTSGSDLGAPELSLAVAGLSPEGVESIPVFARRVLSGLSPLWLLVHLPNMTGAHVAIQAEARGPNDTLLTGWAAGLQAIGEGADLVARGDAEAVLAGGADSPLHAFAYVGLEQAGWLGRPGFVPGEGAVVVVLEEWDRAVARGARILGEILGSASGVAEDEPGVARIARKAGARGPLPPAAGEGSSSAAGHLFAAHGPLDLVLALGAAGEPGTRVVALSRGMWGETAVVVAAAGDGAASAAGKGEE